MKIEAIYPVITLLLGWFLNSMSRHFQDRRDLRHAMGRALADLLEIHHDVYGRSLAYALLKEKIDPVHASAIRGLVSQHLPQNEQLCKRYDEAVNLVAAFDPVLAFKLRSKDMVLKSGPLLASMTGSDSNVLAHVQKMEDQVVHIVEPFLREAISELAKRCGNTTHRTIQKYLAEQSASGDEPMQLADFIREQLASSPLAKPRIAAPVAPSGGS